MVGRGPRIPRGKKNDRWTNGIQCSICGTPFLKEHLSKDPLKLSYEKKWGVHYACHEKMMGMMDRNTV